MKKIFLFLTTLAFLIFTAGMGAFIFIMQSPAIDFSALDTYKSGVPSIVLDDQGNEWTRFQCDKREPIALHKVPQHLINAFLAAEDHTFFEHAGISWRGILRSMAVNLYHGRKVQGGSTITQQLIKLLFFDAQKTFKRKFKEQLYAIIIEQQYSKEQLLEIYLNHVYFGCGIYGIQAACQRFWGCSVERISLGQAAQLAGIVRSPGNYCPLLSLHAAQKRQQIVLSSMLKFGFITQEEYGHVAPEPLTIIERDNNVAPHFKETLRLFLEDHFGKEQLYTGGLIIQTTLNRSLQEAAQTAFAAQCAQLRTTLQPDIDGALISMEVKTGQIKALVGGYNFTTSKFNRALQAKRQIGSIIKPLIYAVALQEGMSFTDTELDEPFELVQNNGQIWKPHNYNAVFNGTLSLAHALSSSNNIIAIKTLLKVGPRSVIELAKKCKLEGPFHEYPSLALGCIDATLREAVSMFNIFANEGVYQEPYYIKWVKNKLGVKVYKAAPESVRILDATTTAKVAKVLMHALGRVKKGWTGNWLECQAISKTGTTNDSRTCWYVGSTPELTTGVYIGCDDNRSLGRSIYPVATAFPIWIGLNTARTPQEKVFSFDASLRELFITQDGKAIARGDRSDALAIFL